MKYSIRVFDQYGTAVQGAECTQETALPIAKALFRQCKIRGRDGRAELFQREDDQSIWEERSIGNIIERG